MSNIDLRKQNKRNFILDLIRTGTKVSRSSLRADSKLAMKTVLQCVEDLLAENLIVETGKGGAAVGRRATYLAINPDGCYWLGMKFTARTVTCVTVDFAGEIQHTRKEILPEGSEAREVLNILCACIREEAEALRSQGKRLGGVGIGVPGMVSAKKDVGVRFVQIPGWQNVPLRREMEKAAGCPVYLEQSVRTTALANLMEKENLGVGNLLYVLVRSGVGMAVLMDREPLSGQTGIAGEIGHVKVCEQGALCSCGKRGCLESEISYQGLARRMREAMKEGKFKGLAEADAGVEALMEGVSRGDPDSLALWQQAVSQLCRVLSPVVAAINPQKVIFSGEITEAPSFLTAVSGYLQEKCPLGACDGLELALAPCDEQYDAVGAACLSMYQVYGVWGASKVTALREEMRL